MNKTVLASFAIVGLLSAALLIGLALHIRTIRASATVYIRADGSISPETAPISSVDNITYTFTGNINDEIVVERSNITVDGAGYTVEGVGSGRGFSLHDITNVTIKKINIKAFYYGVHFNLTTLSSIQESNITQNSYDGIRLLQSSGNTISQNNITNNGNDGIKVMNSSNTNIIYENGVTANNDDGIQVNNCSNNNINGNDIITNNDIGIYILSSSNNSVSGNNITNNRYGIEVSSSSRNSISGNSIVANSWYGVWLDSSVSNNINGNNITNNYDGVYVYECSNNFISGNNITENNEYGIWLFFGSNNSIDGNTLISNNDAGVYIRLSSRNKLSENNVANNSNGIWLSSSSNNTISRNNVANNNNGVKLLFGSSNNDLQHNNFVNNTQQAEVDTGYANSWDDSLEGNYWSDYTGVDLNKDGIGDSARVIDASNADDFPLMGMFSSFNTSLGMNVNVVSNSTIGDFQFFKSPSNSTIKMHVTNMTSTQTAGFCRVCIPHILMTEQYNVTIDGAEPHYANYTLYDNATHRWIYFSYNHSTLEVLIQGLDNEPPTIDIVSPENKTYSVSDVSLNFSVYKPTSWIGYSLDEQENVTISGNTDLTGLSDGVRNITLFANDTVGNMGRSSTVYFTVDTTPPNIVILSPENKTYVVDSVSLNFTINEAASWIGYSLDEQMNVTISGNITIAGLSDGAHTIAVYANDTAGNMGYSAMAYLTIDTLSPNIVILSPENKTYPTSSLALNFIVSEPTSWIGYSLDEQANVTISGNTTLFGLADESHTVIVYANDTAGNMGLSDIVHFTVDTTLPIIEIISPENKTYAMNSVPLSFTVNKEMSWIGYSLDGQTNVTIAGNTTLTDLLDGSHYLIVYANDTFGNMGLSDIVHFTVDSTPPNITVVSQIPPEDNVLPVDEVRVNATVTDDLSTLKHVTLNYTINNGTWFSEEMTNFEGDIWNATIPAFPYCTNVNYTIIAADNVGNTITTEEMGYEYQYHVIPEFPSLIILPLFMITTLLGIIVYKRKHSV